MGTIFVAPTVKSSLHVVVAVITGLLLLSTSAGILSGHT